LPARQGQTSIRATMNPTCVPFEEDGGAGRRRAKAVWPRRSGKWLPSRPWVMSLCFSRDHIRYRAACFGATGPPVRQVIKRFGVESRLCGCSLIWMAGNPRASRSTKLFLVDRPPIPWQKLVEYSVVWPVWPMPQARCWQWKLLLHSRAQKPRSWAPISSSLGDQYIDGQGPAWVVSWPGARTHAEVVGFLRTLAPPSAHSMPGYSLKGLKRLAPGACRHTVPVRRSWPSGF